MTSNSLNTTMHTKEKHPLSMEEEIQKSTSAPESNDPEKVEFEEDLNQVIATDSPKPPASTPGENVEVEEGTTDAAKTEPEYPTGIRFVILTISLMLAVYMVALDTTIICKSREIFPIRRKPN